MDLRVTPLGSTYPGVEILATALDNLAADDWLREVPRAMVAAAGAGDPGRARRRVLAQRQRQPARQLSCCG